MGGLYSSKGLLKKLIQKGGVSPLLLSRFLQPSSRPSNESYLFSQLLLCPTSEADIRSSGTLSKSTSVSRRVSLRLRLQPVTNSERRSAETYFRCPLGKSFFFGKKQKFFLDRLRTCAMSWCIIIRDRPLASLCGACDALRRLLRHVVMLAVNVTNSKRSIHQSLSRKGAKTWDLNIVFLHVGHLAFQDRSFLCLEVSSWVAMLHKFASHGSLKANDGFSVCLRTQRLG